MRREIQPRERRQLPRVGGTALSVGGRVCRRVGVARIRAWVVAVVWLHGRRVSRGGSSLGCAMAFPLPRGAVAVVTAIASSSAASRRRTRRRRILARVSRRGCALWSVHCQCGRRATHQNETNSSRYESRVGREILCARDRWRNSIVDGCLWSPWLGSMKFKKENASVDINERERE